MYDRSFGIEIEFNTNSQGGARYIRPLLKEAGFSHWYNLSHDGSELEISSPILVGKDGLEQVKGVMTCLRAAGCKTNRADGLHVHHDASDFREKPEMVIRAAESWLNNQDNITQFCATRRRGSYVCGDLTEDILNTMKQLRYGLNPWDVSGGKYRALNTSAISYHGTIEFRLHEGTLNFDIAAAWIAFGQAFLESVKRYKKPIPKFKEPGTLLKRMKLIEEQHELLMKKIETRKNEPVVTLNGDFYAAAPGGIEDED